MSSMVKVTGILIFSVSLLAACTKTEPVQISDADLVQEGAANPNAEEVAEEVPEEVVATAEPSLFFRWSLGQSTLIAPPVEIQNEAIQNCRTLGFDTSYMTNIGIDGDEAVAEFGCRGADQ